MKSTHLISVQQTSQSGVSMSPYDSISVQMGDHFGFKYVCSILFESKSGRCTFGVRVSTRHSIPTFQFKMLRVVGFHALVYPKSLGHHPVSKLTIFPAENGRVLVEDVFDWMTDTTPLALRVKAGRAPVDMAASRLKH